MRHYRNVNAGSRCGWLDGAASCHCTALRKGQTRNDFVKPVVQHLAVVKPVVQHLAG